MIQSAHEKCYTTVKLQFYKEHADTNTFKPTNSLPYKRLLD